jgi:DNA polymerase-3 subunit beta
LIIRSGAHSSLIARGRKEAAALVVSIHQGPTFITARVLHQLITRTIFAVSDDERRQNLNLALLILRPTSLTMVATDGHRLSFVEKTNERISGVRVVKQVLIPLLPLQELHQLLLDPSVETVLFVEEDDTLTFHVGQRAISWAKPTENFPDYESVMTKETQDIAKFVTVRACELSAAIQSVYQNDFRRFVIRLRLDQNMLCITGSSDFIGEYEETIGTSYTADAVEAAFNANYLHEFIEALGDQGNVRLSLKTMLALEIEPEENVSGYRWRYLCCCMRIHSAYLLLPMDFTTSVSARVLQSLIIGADFWKLNEYERYELEEESSLLVMKRESITIVIREGIRLYLHEAENEYKEGFVGEHQILIPHGSMRFIQQLLAGSDAEYVELAENDCGFRFRIGNRTHAWAKDPIGERRYDAVIPPMDFTSSMSSKSFNAFINLTFFAVPKEDSRYTLDGALLVLRNETLTMVATDGYRLTFAEMTNDLTDRIVGEKRIIIAHKILLEIMHLLSISQTHRVEFAENEAAYSCRIGDQILSWVKPTMKFPDYDAVLLDEKAKIAVVQADELRDAILCACGPSGWNQVRDFAMIIRQGELIVVCESAKDEKREKSIGALYAGEPLTIKLVTSNILGFLDALGGTHSVSLAFKDGQSAMEMRTEGFNPNYRWRYLVMPRKSS